MDTLHFLFTFMGYVSPIVAMRKRRGVVRLNTEL